jgi:hypothetical protein
MFGGNKMIIFLTWVSLMCGVISNAIGFTLKDNAHTTKQIIIANLLYFSGIFFIIYGLGRLLGFAIGIKL